MTIWTHFPQYTTGVDFKAVQGRRWRGCGGTGAPVPGRQGRETVQPPRGTAWQFLRKAHGPHVTQQLHPLGSTQTADSRSSESFLNPVATAAPFPRAEGGNKPVTVDGAQTATSRGTHACARTHTRMRECDSDTSAERSADKLPARMSLDSIVLRGRRHAQQDPRIHAVSSHSSEAAGGQSGGCPGAG